MPSNFSINQRVRVKTSNGAHKPPTEAAKGAEGKIAEQLMDDWTGTRLALEPGETRLLYVEFESGTTEAISEEWLEPMT
jgi:hypothetical protein